MAVTIPLTVFAFVEIIVTTVEAHAGLRLRKHRGGKRKNTKEGGGGNCTTVALDYHQQQSVRLASIVGSAGP